MLPSYRNQSIDWSSDCANQLTGFCKKATLALSGWMVIQLFSKLKMWFFFQKLTSGFTLTVWKVSQCRVFSGPYFSAFELKTPYLCAFSPNPGKYEPQKTPHLDTFHAASVHLILTVLIFSRLEYYTQYVLTSNTHLL